jgi:hypothetical protein
MSACLYPYFRGYLLKNLAPSTLLCMTIVFDTHTWIKRLREAGFTEEQAEKEAGLMRETLTANF